MFQSSVFFADNSNLRIPCVRACINCCLKLNRCEGMLMLIFIGPIKRECTRVVLVVLLYKLLFEVELV